MSEDFFRRWSRLKRQAGDSSPASTTPPATSAPELPPIDSLTFESEFKDFMHSKVEERVKRAALKKLFADPRFNVMDGLDTYVDDYTKAEPITEELLAQIEHARRALVLPPPEEPKQEQEAALAEDKKDGDPGQDPKSL